MIYANKWSLCFFNDLNDNREVLGEGGQIEMKLGQAVVEFEIKIEECVLKPLQTILDHDLPNIYKLKRTLSKLTENMDAAKAKLQQASRHSMSTGTTGKIDNIKEEWEDAQQKVEQCRDNLAAEMYALLARESEISRLIVNLLNYQKEYHKSIHDILDELVPGVDAAISSSVHKPVYGEDLGDHLTTTKRKIAYPIELCICGMLETGLDEEGLFRIAGSTSKVKKLKSAFDAGILDLDGLLREFGDPHVMANALKCYLRELPVPLLTADLYDDWMNAIRITEGQEKLKALWTVVQKLPKYNLDNLAYLVKFLKELCLHQDVNKMSPANIAIVIGPNLLWSTVKAEDLTGDNNPMGMNMTMTHHYSSVLDQLVSYCDYFFPDGEQAGTAFEQDLHTAATTGNRTPGLLSNGLSGATHATIDESQELESDMKRSQSCSSVDEHSPPHGSPKPVLRRKNKPAPVPPINPHPTKTSPTPQRNNSTEKDNSAQLTKTNSFNNRNSQQFTEPARMSPSVEKEKREGMWIPPSPSQMVNRKLNLGGDSNRPPSMAPPKPPQPQFDSSRPSRFTNLPVQPNEPPPKPSPLKYKSSFKTSASIDGPPAASEHPSPSRHNTTDNIDSSHNASNAFANSNQFCSLPRHFHTDNSYKNQRAPRAPSIFNAAPSVPPPHPPAPISLPPTNTLISATAVAVTEPEAEERRGSEIHIGFEKLEQEVRKSSTDKSGDESAEEGNKINSDQASVTQHNNNNNNNTKGQTVVPNPPVPMPRVSLNQGGSPPIAAKEQGGNPPTARERPSIMAKPRDLPKRTQSQNKGAIPSSVVVAAPSSANVSHHHELSSGSGGESDNPDGSNASQSTTVVDEGSTVLSEDSVEVCRNGGPKSLPLNQQLPLSPTSRVPYRPPRPHPPPPPKVSTKPSQGESTDL
ncbi:Rho GTPase-activating protein 44 [Orchesella cincta]|uniref:Rho GTPase-activating protein 44 n=1 Tax=Orchesella cincta TaxID=48709 RepID=A0A1D2NH83_ORCCI|nr:Rho GTPase-activating protein 44 [Orchesella cincta]